MSTIRIFLLMVMGGLFLTSISYADEPSAKNILHRADMARGNLDGIKWIVKVVSIEENNRQDRDLLVKARGYDFLGILNSPPKVKGQKLLMIDHNMWFTKPGLKKPVPISSRQKLVGGASYGDIAATNYAEDYEAVFLPEENIGGEMCYVFDLKAKTKKATYDQIKYWISKDRGVGVKSDFYTVSGKLFKSAVFRYDNHVVIEGKKNPFISQMIITDALVQSNVTTLNFIENELITVPDSAFDLNLFMDNS